MDTQWFIVLFGRNFKSENRLSWLHDFQFILCPTSFLLSSAQHIVSSLYLCLWLHPRSYYTYDPLFSHQISTLPLSSNIFCPPNRYWTSFCSVTFFSLHSSQISPVSIREEWINRNGFMVVCKSFFELPLFFENRSWARKIWSKIKGMKHRRIRKERDI